MKKWYQFYKGIIDEPKLQQFVGEMPFPISFSYVPWGHHILIITKCKTIEEALFYININRTINENLSRKALDDYIRADLYRTSGAAVTNFPDKLPTAQGKLAQDMLMR